MPDWSNPLEITKDAEIFQKLCLVMLGLSTWETINQLPFDWSVISRKREAHWPSFFYFYCKYSLWFAVIGVNIALNVTTKVNCQALYTFDQFAGTTAIGSASTLLMLRTIAVWDRALLVTVPLVVASLGQWGILFHGIASVRSSWSDVAGACVVDAASPVFIELIYLYTMSFDLIVLVLTAVGLVMSPGRSSLWQLLFRQGIVYFLVAFLANMVPTIFLLLNLNPMMNLMFTIPAAVASAIVACRSFVSLTNFRQKDIYVHSTLPYSSTRVGTGGDARGGGAGDAGEGSLTKKKREEGNTIAGIVFHGMGAGIESMGEAYSMDELDTTKTTTTLGALDSNRAYDFGREVRDGNEHVVVHMETIVHDQDGVQKGGHVNVVDLEKAETTRA